jgi:hypothetical protein
MVDYPRARPARTWLKKLRVIAGLIAGSAAAGAVAAVVTLLLKVAIVVGPDYPRLNVPALGVAVLVMAAIGAAMGGVLAPLAALVFLRHVPLGRVLGWTVSSTVAGAAAGFYAGLRDASLLTVGAGALIGFVIGVFGLSRARRATSR